MISRVDSTGRNDSTARKTKLAEQVRERLARGLAPPREAYLVHNRHQIDWTEVPEWARPSDPELFDGCSHEG